MQYFQIKKLSNIQIIKNSPVCSVKAEDGLNLNINNTNEKVKTKEKIRVA
jgi:hypothetical protein